MIILRPRTARQGQRLLSLGSVRPRRTIRSTLTTTSSSSTLDPPSHFANRGRAGAPFGRTEPGVRPPISGLFISCSTSLSKQGQLPHHPAPAPGNLRRIIDAACEPRDDTVTTTRIL